LLPCEPSGSKQRTLVVAALDESREYLARSLRPHQKGIRSALYVPTVVTHPYAAALEVPEANVEGKTYQSVKLALMTSSSRAKSGHAALKSRKVLRQESVHLSHREAAIPAIGYR
jgi:hypothetical protein